MVLVGALASLLAAQSGVAGGVRQIVLLSLEPQNMVVRFVQRQHAAALLEWSYFWEGSQRLAQLEQERLRLLVDSEELELLRKENELLRQSLRWQQESGLPVVPLRGSQLQWFVRAGCRSELQVGSAVFTDKTFVGIASRVWREEAQLQTLRTPDLRLDVMVGTASARAVLRTDRGKPELSDSLQFRQIQVGDVVLTAGGQGVPQNLLVGRVLSLAHNERQEEFTAQVEPYLWPELVSAVSYEPRSLAEGEACL